MARLTPLGRNNALTPHSRLRFSGPNRDCAPVATAAAASSATNTDDRAQARPWR